MQYTCINYYIRYVLKHLLFNIPYVNQFVIDATDGNNSSTCTLNTITVLQ